MYTLSRSCRHRSLTSIKINHHPPLNILIFNIFEHMCLIYFSVHYNPPLNIVKITVFEVNMFHDNKYLIPSDDSSDLSPGNNDPTKNIKFVLVGIPFRNKLVWVEISK